MPHVMYDFQLLKRLGHLYPEIIIIALHFVFCYETTLKSATLPNCNKNEIPLSS